MPENLSLRECEELGIVFPCNRMDNGEFRFRLMDNGPNRGWGYILTKMPETACGWQNSHYHKGVCETFIIQKGWIGFADFLPNGDMKIIVYRENELFTTQPGRVHNVYMAAGTVVHTVKHGDCSLANDWFASLEFDAKTKHLSEADIYRLAGLNKG